MNKGEKLQKSVEKSYDNIAIHFSETRKFIWPEMKDAATLIADDSSVLDIGCGNGRFLEALKNKKITYRGVDISKKMIEIASKKYSQNKFEQKDYLSLNDKNKYDYIVSFAAFHHLATKQDRIEATKKIKNALKENGVFIGTVWNMWSTNKIKYILQSLFEFIRGKALSPYDCMIPWKNNSGEIITNRFYYAFSKKELINIFKKAGFKNIDIGYTPKGKSIFKASNIFFIVKKR